LSGCARGAPTDERPCPPTTGRLFLGEEPLRQSKEKSAYSFLCAWPLSVF
jgi:hypothetical protein